VLLSVPILAVFAAAARPFALFVGSQWADAVGPLRILCAFYAIGVVSNLLVPALQAAQRPGLTAAFTWTAAAISVAGLLLAVRLTAGDGPQTRLTAIALSALAMEALITGAMVWVTFGRVLRQPMRPFLGALAPGFAASGLAFGTGWFVERSIALDSQFLAFIVVAAAGFVVAAVCLVLFDPWVRGRVTRLVRPPRPLPQE
jgi:O-antigen/teichoic acid export membrane protein